MSETTPETLVGGTQDAARDTLAGSTWGAACERLSMGARDATRKTITEGARELKRPNETQHETPRAGREYAKMPHTEMQSASTPRDCAPKCPLWAHRDVCQPQAEGPAGVWLDAARRGTGRGLDVAETWNEGAPSSRRR